MRRLCQLLDAERVYRELATILEGEADLEFATIMVQVGSLVVRTSFCLTVYMFCRLDKVHYVNLLVIGNFHCKLL